MSDSKRIIELLEAIVARLDGVVAKPDEKRYLTVREAAEFTGLSSQAVYRLRCCIVKVGRAVRIDRRRLDRHLNRESLK